MKVNSILEKDEIRHLVKPSNLKGFQALFTTWGLIASSFGMVMVYPSVWTVLIAWIIIGGRQLALAILMHDAAHYSLFRTRGLNDLVGTWLCAYAVGQNLKQYRTHHMKHHRYAGSEKDPDLDLVEGFPVTQRSLSRKLLRDLSGVTGVKRLYGILLIDLGRIQYTVSSRVVRIERSHWPSFLEIFRNLFGKLLVQAILLGALVTLGAPELYLLWSVAYLTTFSAFIRIRSIAEHACLKQDLNPVHNTRTTYASWFERLTVAPHRVNFHLEHHLLMAVPYFNLPKVHQVLKDRGALKSASIVRGYWEVLRIASRTVP